MAQPSDIPAYDESIFIAPVPVVGASIGTGPGPIQSGDKEIVVSISQQTMWAYENGELVVSTLVSTGVGNVPDTVTSIGYFSVLTKYDFQTMEGTISHESSNVSDVPWVMYFDNNGNAANSTDWHSNFGSPMSHACVNLPLDIAELLYGWAPVGTAVTDIG
jgi:lipoprotein-anchoring transpeptidase ErfK/SrfK